MNQESDTQIDLVMAKLDRAPQDPLHAAVVLEAWAGRPSTQTLDDTQRMGTAEIPTMGPSLRPVPVDNLIDIKEFTVLVTVLASVFLWLPRSSCAGPAPGGRIGRPLANDIPLVTSPTW
ncbi:MAG: hypothetical protein AAF480_01330 [Actinomycetota bacterium]